MVVCYYGGSEGRREVGATVGGANIMADTLVVFHTDSQKYSVSRYTMCIV